MNINKPKDHETVMKQFEKSLNDHETIMKHVEEVFKDKSKDDFGNLIIDKEISEYIKAIYVKAKKEYIKEKKEKIKFILSFTNDDLRPSHPYYKDQFKRYLKMDNQEIDFNYYHFKEEAKKYGL